MVDNLRPKEQFLGRNIEEKGEGIEVEMNKSFLQNRRKCSLSLERNSMMVFHDEAGEYAEAESCWEV